MTVCELAGDECAQTLEVMRGRLDCAQAFFSGLLALTSLFLGTSCLPTIITWSKRSSMIVSWRLPLDVVLLMSPNKELSSSVSRGAVKISLPTMCALMTPCFIPQYAVKVLTLHNDYIVILFNIGHIGIR